jgi:ABC-type multidrug transport system fused ATPase/permease subunit
VAGVVYRLQSDAAFLDELLLRGILLVLSGTTLIVMFVILASIDLRLALVSLAVGPRRFSSSSQKNAHVGRVDPRARGKAEAAES